jgi:hypothetical protein
MAAKPKTKKKTQKPRAAPKVREAREKATTDRVRPQFAVLRQGLINIRASRGDSTAGIAKDFGVNRSYVIRLTSFGMKPENAAERAVMKQAAGELPALQRLGMGFAGKEGFETTLAGDDGRRGAGGGRPRLDGKPSGSPKTPKTPKTPAPSARAKPKATKKVKVLARKKPAADDDSPAAAESARAARTKAKEVNQKAKAAKTAKVAKAAVPKKPAKPAKAAKAAKPTKPTKTERIRKIRNPKESTSETSASPPIAGAPDIGDILDQPASAFAT